MPGHLCLLHTHKAEASHCYPGLSVPRKHHLPQTTLTPLIPTLTHLPCLISASVTLESTARGVNQHARNPRSSKADPEFALHFHHRDKAGYIMLPHDHCQPNKLFYCVSTNAMAYVRGPEVKIVELALSFHLYVGSGFNSGFQVPLSAH